MQTPELEELARLARAIRATAHRLLQEADDLSALVARHGPGRSETPGPQAEAIAIDPASFSVVWRGRRCLLGYTLAFRLLRHLAQRPDQYVRVDALLHDIWSGQRSRSAVRTAVADLRRRLAAAGMADLAGRIDGRSRGHYGLMLSQAPPPARAAKQIRQ